MKIIKVASVSYTALVVDNPSDILSRFNIPEGWEKIAHHVTLNMGASKNPEVVGKSFTVQAVAVAQDDKVMAVKVQMPSGLVTANATPHITLAVNRAGGGKPVMSNKLNDWKSIESFAINGVVTEVSN